MIVYHGSTEIIQKPDVLHSYWLLDFGQGFTEGYRQIADLRFLL